MSESLSDPRRTPARSDLAAWHLRSVVDAARYVRGVDHGVCLRSSSLHGRPESSAQMLTEVLFGETFTVYDQTRQWSWGQLATDGYVGWIESACLQPDPVPATHRVRVSASHLYSEPDLKSPVVTGLPVNARLGVTDSESSWHRTAQGWVPRHHLVPVIAVLDSWVGIAEQLTGVPYLWGGRSNTGIDCSALVQLALSMAGVKSPRDSDMQYDEVGDVCTENQTPQRGDLVFWSGHVGLMTSATELIHANAHHMAVVTEPLRIAAERIAADHGPIIGRKRVEKATLDHG